MSNNKKLSITLVRSPIGRQPSHRATVKGLGLRRLHQTVQLEDNVHTRGMVNKVSYLLEVQSA